MTSLRVFGSSHCILFQLPAPLRQCSPVHTHLLSRPCTPLVRLFHASPVQAVRKPSRAIVQPTKTSSSSRPANKRPSSPPKKLDLPFLPHPPTSPSQSITPKPLVHLQSSSETRHSVSPPLLPSHAQTESPTTLSVPRAPQEYLLPTVRLNNQYQTFINQLATRPEPTVIYTARSQWIFVTTCVASAAFMTYAAWINVPTIRFANETGAIGLVISTTVCAVGMSVASVALGVGPHHLLKRIVAIPATASKQAQAGQKTAQGLQPTLRFEPVRVGFGFWPKPFEIPVTDVVSDRPLALEMPKWASKRASNPFALVFSAFWAMFARREYFSYVRVEDRGNWKLPLQNAEALDGGKGEFDCPTLVCASILIHSSAAFDQLIKVDNKTVHWKSRLVRT